MTPPIEAWPVHELSQRVQIENKNGTERLRKGPFLNLEKCRLMEMVQYKCEPTRVPGKGGKSELKVQCEPVVRLFRR